MKVELGELVTNSELVTSALGSWPSFHDAEIVSVELRREPGRTARLTFKVMPYGPAEMSKEALLTIQFKGVEELRLANFNEQNVIWNLALESEGARTRLEISSSYGLEGSFRFLEAEVEDVEILG